MSDVNSLLTQILNRLSVIESKMGVSSPEKETQELTGDQPKSLVAFDKYYQEKLIPFYESCVALGGDAEAAGKNIKEAWEEMRSIILTATKCKEPSQAELPKLLEKLKEKMQVANSLVKRNEWEKHTKTCYEGMGCLNWVVVKPAPLDFIESYIGGSDYWANGIRKEYKSTRPDHIAFCDTFKGLLLGLMEYVKENHRTGLSWNPKGGSFSSFEGTPSTSTSAPVKSEAIAKPTSTSGAPKANTSALFADLNKEGAITSGLKKVTKDMQTWRSEYKGGSEVAPVKRTAAPKPTNSANQPKGPPKFEFQNGSNRWMVEYHTESNSPVNITIGNIKETVYVLGCIGATIDVQGKCKSIIVDGCKKTTVFFDNAMASCEVVNCQRVHVHCRQTVSAVSIDKTDGVVVHLPKTSLETEIVASKSSEMNVSWPDENDEMIEKPIPEQYVHRIKNGNVTAEVSDLYH